MSDNNRTDNILNMNNVDNNNQITDSADIKSKKATLFKYLGWSFGLAWAMQLFIGYASRTSTVGVIDAKIVIAQLFMTLMMFVPLLSVILTKQKLGNMGWKPKFKGNIGYILFAWFMPAILTAIGAAIYFLIFPSHLDLTGQVLVDTAGYEALEQLEAQCGTYLTYIVISGVAALTYAPLINMIPAVGEEAGWRGYMYPVLKELYGKKKGIILGGIIWGMWHWPLMLLIGYEYGTAYRGFPTVGWVLFAIYTIAIGILCNYVYEKSHCIWIPAILHGAVNAAATIPAAITTSESAPYRILGPAPIGLIAGIPMMIVAAIILFKTTKSENDAA
ncbi:CPBP family intramembrane glutamic endopeptidase [Butyrivibrio proteoclasticus]|uniref:CPBP family intramembrane glutamic endopeptidase n=1 Tax=Butyrivibrio proteoclasticus TaxID=43305 RepID=UPI0006887799|nr:CPBP family intramembrane glutamic endopeptidase [Butyrivibrio proteoclasticus]